MRALGRLIVAAILVLLGRRRGRGPDAREQPTVPTASTAPETAAGRPRVEDERIVDEQPRAPLAERAVLLCLVAATACAVAFIVVYAVDPVDNRTQLLGLALGLSFGFLAVAAVVASRYLVSVEEIDEPYPGPEHEPEQAQVEQIMRESGDRLTRRRLVVVAAGGAGTVLGAALLTPLVSLGPFLDIDRLRRSPWRRGIRLVDRDGRPIRAIDVVTDAFFTAFPEGADPEELGSPLVVVRVDPSRLDLPEGRERWAPGGIVAYSKICTHAGCAVSLYRTPSYEPTSAAPALICPCHYSTFDPATGAEVLFGPAGRPLPQLPLSISGDGELVAAGDYSGPIGPSWAGVRSS